MVLNLCEQIRPMCDELIVTDDGDYSQDLEKIADIYLQGTATRLGHARNVARGVGFASSQFIGILDSDITITRGTLRDLCIPFSASYGTWKEWPLYRELMGWCFVIDSVLLSKNPVVTPALEGLGEWIVGLYDDGVFVDSFEYSHPMNSSYKIMWELGGRTTEMILRREIDPIRHRQRMVDDLAYRAIYET